jgi:hypothetical protein
MLVGPGWIRFAAVIKFESRGDEAWLEVNVKKEKHITKGKLISNIIKTELKVQKRVEH